MKNHVLGKGIRRWITFLLYIVSFMYICSGKKRRSYFVRLLTIKRPLTVCSADCCGKKLLNSGMNAKVLRVIRDMYAKAKPCVKLGMVYRIFLSQTLVCVRGKICRHFCFRCFWMTWKVCVFTSNNVQGLKLPFALAQDVCLQDIDKHLFIF